jgi:hypothetical protein
MKEIVFPTRVVNCRRAPYDVYIGRGSKWGNPWTHLLLAGTLAEYQVATREDAIDAFECYLLDSELIHDLHELKGQILGCYCKPRSCHGDILARLANQL